MIGNNANQTFNPSRPIHGDLMAYMHYSPIIVELLNQIAQGTEREAVELGRAYGADDHFGQTLHGVAKAIVINHYAAPQMEIRSLEDR